MHIDDVKRERRERWVEVVVGGRVGRQPEETIVGDIIKRERESFPDPRHVLMHIQDAAAVDDIKGRSNCRKHFAGLIN